MSRSYRDCLKTVFQEEKNIDMNAIKHETQPMIQTTFLTLNQKIKHIDPKNKHTHTLNKSNQFYISKQVEIV